MAYPTGIVAQCLILLTVKERGILVILRSMRSCFLAASMLPTKISFQSLEELTAVETESLRLRSLKLYANQLYSKC